MKTILALVLTCVSTLCAATHTSSGPLVINGQSGTTLENLHITSTSGPCLTITNSTAITIHNSEIGPCGGNGIVISGGSGIRILDSYIHPEHTQSACCDSGDGIYSTGTSNILIQGNVVAYGEDNILLVQSNGGSVTGNFLLNPRNYGGNRGVNIQLYNGTVNMTVQNNYTLSSNDSKYAYPQHQEDSINFIGAAAHTSNITAKGNYVTGGTSGTGCGIIADSGADNVHFLSNILVNTGQCGIGVADGVNQVIDSNRIYNTDPIAYGGNTGIYTWKVYATDPPCGPVQITNNTVTAINTLGQDNSYYDAGGCGPVSQSGNIFGGSAVAALSPVASKLAPPMIPPQPFSCAAVSPFTNQTAASCSGTAAPTVSLMQPGANTTLSGTVTLAANPSSGVSSVAFMMDGNTTLGQVTASPWLMSLNTSNLTNGNHMLTAVAALSGVQTVSTAIPVTIQNSAPVTVATVPTLTPSTGLNGNLWTLTAPAGGSYTSTSTELSLVVPGGSNHDPAFGGVNQSVRITQPVGNVDFSVQAKFDSIPTAQYQFEGILIQQDATDYLYFQIGSDGAGQVCNVGVINGGIATAPLGGSHIPVPAGTTSIRLRVTRSGNTFTEYWSIDGNKWNSMGSFVQSIKMSSMGLFAGNYSSSPSAAAAITVPVDFFVNDNVTPPGQPVTDQFGQSNGLNTNLWTFVAPAGGNYSGTSTDLSLVAPAGRNHDPAAGGVDQSVRIIQPVGNGNFSVQTKFDAIPSQKYQFEGLLVQQDTSHYLWFQLGSDGSGLVCNVGVMWGTTATAPLGSTYITLPAKTTSIRLRVTRSQDTFTESWSTDNITWHSMGSFVQPLQVTSMGPFAGNYNDVPSLIPAFTLPIDFFLNESPAPTGQPVTDQFNQ